MPADPNPVEPAVTTLDLPDNAPAAPSVAMPAHDTPAATPAGTLAPSVGAHCVRPAPHEDMPPHWRVARLGDVGQLVRGVTYDKDDATERPTPGYLPVLRATNITDSGLLLCDELVFVRANKVSQSQLLHIGDIVIAMSSGSKSVVGKSAQLAHDWIGSCGAFCAAFRPDTGVVAAFFVANVLKSSRYREYIITASRGTNINNLSKDHILGYEFALPPLPEQRAIARALRAVQDAIAARRREADLEREHKSALMQNLFTHGTRGEPTKQTEIGEMPASWRMVRLGDCCEFLQYGTSERCDADASGIPVLRIPNVIDGKVDVTDLKYIHLPDATVENLTLKRGDLLFVRTNGRREYTGRCAVYWDEAAPALFASYLIRARLAEGSLLPAFARLYTETGAGRDFLSGRASNAADGKFNINTQTIKNVLTPRPSIEEQGEIVSVLDACDAKIAALDRETALLDEFFRAILEELMTGRVSAVPLIEAAV